VLLRAWHAARDPVIYNDGPEFIAMAGDILAGRLSDALAHAFHPLTSGLIAGVAAASGVDLETAGRIVSVASGGAESQRILADAASVVRR
jgi:hypothetical protein